jgi:hypothetical protein
MHRNTLFLVILACCSSARLDGAGEKPFREEWRLGHRSNGYSVKETRDGAAVVVGTSGDRSAYFAGDTQVWLLKTDGDGEVLWKRTLGQGEGFSLDIAADGGLVVAGRQGGGEAHGWITTDRLVKTDASGNLLWERTFGAGEARCVVESSQAGVVLTGTRRGAGIYLLKTDPGGELLWEKSLGAGEGWSVRETAGGGFVVTGGRPTSITSMELVLLKTDGVGNLLWERSFEHAWGLSVAETADGGIVAAGRHDSPDSAERIYLLKTDAGGTLLWERTFRGGYLDWGFSVQETADRGLVVAGSTGGYDAYLLKTDANGFPLWERTFGETDDYIGFGVEEAANGDLFLTGPASLLRTDAQGGILWELREPFGTSYYERHLAVQPATDGGSIVVGTRPFPFRLFSGFGIRVMKVTPDGRAAWERTIHRESRGAARSVVETADGGYLLGGVLSKDVIEGSDLYLARTDATGRLLWERTFGGDRRDEGFSVQETPDGGAVAVGTTESLGEGAVNVYVVRTDAAGNLLWEKALFGWGITVGGATSVALSPDGGFAVGIWFSLGRVSALYEDYPREISMESSNFVVRLDSSGDYLWAWEERVNDADGLTVQATTDGFVAAGRESVVKLDAKGALLWSRSLLGWEWPGGLRPVVETPGGGFLLLASITNSGFKAARYDRDGDLLWESNVLPSHPQGLGPILETEDGGLLVAYGGGLCDLRHLFRGFAGDDIGCGGSGNLVKFQPDCAADLVAPEIRSPGDFSVECSALDGTAVVVLDVTAVDTCDPSPRIACDPSSGSVFAAGTHAVTCTATDAAGNSASVSFTVTVECGRQLPGDCNPDGALDVSDAICLLGHLFLGVPARLPCGGGTLEEPGNRRLLDANGDRVVDIADAVSLLGYLFLGAPPPVSGTLCLPIARCPSNPSCN